MASSRRDFSLFAAKTWGASDYAVDGNLAEHFQAGPRAGQLVAEGLARPWESCVGALLLAAITRQRSCFGASGTRKTSP